MTILGLDCGSSSIKAAILREGRVIGKIARAAYPTQFVGVRAEVDPKAVLKALCDVVHQIGASVKKVDVIALDVMAPSWLAMDKHGKPLTRIITHQDRRSESIAKRLVKEMGKSRLLHLSGNLPFPGGISSTTWAWFHENRPSILKRADLVGHLSTFLHRTLTGSRTVDPSNASFMGVYSTVTLKGWNDELCDAIGAKRALLPDVIDGNEVAGHITPQAARRFGLMAGTPMIAGVMDGSAAMLLPGSLPGQLLNICGSTDVLALCTDHPKPHEQLLTRALGIGRKWMHVSTIAAAGSAFAWANQQLFADLSEARFHELMDRLAKHPLSSSVNFDPYLGGDRARIDQPTAAFTGLTLSTTREQMLSAMIESLAAASARRLPLLQRFPTKMNRQVMLTGGLQHGLAGILHRDWPGRWTFSHEDEATLRGLAKLTPKQ